MPTTVRDRARRSARLAVLTLLALLGACGQSSAVDADPQAPADDAALRCAPAPQAGVVVAGIADGRCDAARPS